MMATSPPWPWRTGGSLIESVRLVRDLPEVVTLAPSAPGTRMTNPPSHAKPLTRFFPSPAQKTPILSVPSCRRHLNLYLREALLEQHGPPSIVALEKPRSWATCGSTRAPLPTPPPRPAVVRAGRGRLPRRTGRDRIRPGCAAPRARPHRGRDPGPAGGQRWQDIIDLFSPVEDKLPDFWWPPAWTPISG